MKNIPIIVLAGLALAVSAAISAAMPAAALPVDGLTVGAVKMRSGPGVRYRSIVTLPAGAQVTIYGCLPASPWCDVAWYGRRGWVAADSVEASYAYYPPGGSVFDDEGSDWDGGGSWGGGGGWGGHGGGHHHDVAPPPVPTGPGDCRDAHGMPCAP